MKLGKLPARMPTLKQDRIQVSQGHSDRRVTGRRLQDRRLRMWTDNPHCAACGQFTMFPDGFELDHKVPLHQGGEDSESNLQVLCVHWDIHGNKAGCHAKKTASDMGHRGRQ